MGVSPDKAETARIPTTSYTVTQTRDLWMLLRLVCGVQGAYYLATGLWLLVDRFVAIPGPLSVMALTARTFGNDALVAITALIGLVLLLSSYLRVRPDGLFTFLGFGTALTFLIAGWRHRGAFSGWIYLELLAELLLALALFGSFWAAVIADRRQR